MTTIFFIIIFGLISIANGFLLMKVPRKLMTMRMSEIEDLKIEILGKVRKYSAPFIVGLGLLTSALNANAAISGGRAGGSSFRSSSSISARSYSSPRGSSTRSYSSPRGSSTKLYSSPKYSTPGNSKSNTAPTKSGSRIGGNAFRNSPIRSSSGSDSSPRGSSVRLYSSPQYYSPGYSTSYTSPTKIVEDLSPTIIVEDADDQSTASSLEVKICIVVFSVLYFLSAAFIVNYFVTKYVE